MDEFKNNYLLLLIVACICIFFVNLDALYVNIMEARNFITAREMLHDGNWILTTLNGEPRYQKPPLPTWLTAFSAALFGLKSLVALRLPAAIMGLTLVLTSYFFVEKLLKNERYAFISALVLSTSFYVVSASRDGNWDIFTHAFMMLCIYQLYLFFTGEEKTYKRAVYAAIFFGCSFMSKGPVSLYALLLPFLIAYGSVFRFKGLKYRWREIAVFALVAIALSGWWYWYTYAFDSQAVAEITQRETSNWTSYNIRPFYYYWSFFTQSGVWTIMAFISLLYPYMIKRAFDKKGYRFSFWWTMASLILLSIIPEKKSRYLLPVLIPLAMNTAFYLEYLFREFGNLTRKKETYPVYFNFGLIACIGLVFPIGGFFLLGDNLTGKWGWFILLSVALVLLGLYILKKLKQKNIEKVFVGTILFIIAIMCFGMPMARALTVNPEYRPMSQLRQWQEQTKVPVFEFGGFTPELIWDYGEPIEVLADDGEIRLPRAGRFGVLVARDDQARFRNTFSDFYFEKITRYDMNPKGPESSVHKTRLYRDLYLVTRRPSVPVSND